MNPVDNAPQQDYADVGMRAPLNHLGRLARLIADGESLDAVLADARQSLEISALSLFVREGDALRCIVGHHVPPRSTVGEGLVGRAAANGRIEREPLAAGGECLAMPLVAHGHGIGVLVGVLDAGVLTAEATLSLLAGLLIPLVEVQKTSANLSRQQPQGIVGQSDAMHAVFRQVAQVASSETTVLLEGESGSGKELVAAAIHQQSPRAKSSMVRVNCAALPDSLIESELFGHERGAFTGAHARRKGRFELAEGGTLFLDEVGDLSATAQAKLLRVLQEHELERVGGGQTIPVDVRVIAATHRNLSAHVEKGLFREDLYYRLCVFPVRIPPLRERKSDIPLLVEHFLEKHSAQKHSAQRHSVADSVSTHRRPRGRGVRRISTSALDLLMSYPWPGNVRELENCIERAVLVTEDDVVRVSHLHPSVQAGTGGTGPRTGLNARLDEVEREMLVETLKASRGNAAKAARLLDITERMMGIRLKKHGIDWRTFRPQ